MPKSPRELVQVGCYLRQDQAEERGLVVLALERPYWILEEDGLYALYVDGADAATVTAELEKFEAERDVDLRRAREAYFNERPVEPPRKTPLFSLFIYVWMLCFFYGLQTMQGAAWTERGLADSRAILHGEIWRTVTALTLHADLGHLFANITVGIVFAWALLPVLGTGWTWMSMIGCGAVGNALNALIYKGGSHLSLGASTAVFAGLGILVGWQIAVLLRPSANTATWRWRDILLPFGAGLALLAYLGVGGEHSNVDIFAHAFGMAVGVGCGFLLSWTHLPEKTSSRVQHLLAALALLTPTLAWLWALGLR